MGDSSSLKHNHTKGVIMKGNGNTILYIGGCSGSNSPEFTREAFGGLTTALGIRTRDTGIFIDNGSGVGKVSSYLLKQGITNAYGLQTHFHLDHRLGIPLNKLLFVPNLVKGLYAPKLSQRSFKNMFNDDFGKETWPVAPSGIPILEFEAGEVLLVSFGVKTMLQNHPGANPEGGSTAYRVSTGDGDVVISTDSEPLGDHGVKMAEFVSGSVALYIDIQYRTSEYHGKTGVCGGSPMSRVGWGHGTPEMLYDIMSNCSRPPKKVIIGHHDPARTTEDLYRFEGEVREKLSVFSTSVWFAREGDEIEL